MAYRGSSDNRLMIVEIGGSKVGVFYRSPTPSEYVAYHRDKLKLRGGKLESRLTETNLKFGMKVITGVQEGDIEYRENGEWKALDTTLMPEAEWKAIVEREFFDLVDFVGSKVFNPVEGAGDRIEGDDSEESVQKK